jgi:sugar transferase EpsL
MPYNGHQFQKSDTAQVTSISSFYRVYLKRILDILGAITVLCLIWPVLLILFILLRISIGSPVLFRQRRPGLNGEPFIIYKFRTMADSRNFSGKLLTDDQRITHIGRYIRSLSLDELPELFNVLKGDMSFVGPRPLMMQYLERYSPEQARRHEVLPGITGWAQVRGRNSIPWPEKFALDIWYVDHQSFFLDIDILLATVWKVIRREGISEVGYISASEFMGNQNDAPPRSE